MSESIHTPIPNSVVSQLRAGDRVTISGVVYAGCAPAYAWLVEAVRHGETIPIDLEGHVICCLDKPIARNGVAWGISIGNGLTPESNAPLLLAEGVRGIIGQGTNSATMRYTYRKYRAVQFAPAAQITEHVEAALVAMGEGIEAIVALTLRDFPVIVANDAHGGDTPSIPSE